MEKLTVMKRNKRSDKYSRILSIFLCIIVLKYISSANAEFQVGGYYKNYSTLIDATNNTEPMTGAAVNRLRLNLAYAPTERFSFVIAYDFTPRIQDPLLFTESPFAVAIPSSRYRLVDMRSRFYPFDNETMGNVGIYHNLDRAALQWSSSFFDIIIGRDAIAWGSARIINPTDVVAPFTYDQLDTEDRVGVDAFRVRVPVGVLGEVDAGYILGNNFNYDKRAIFFRTLVNAIETDFSVLLLEFQKERLIGLDITRGIAGAGFWLETAYVFIRSLKHPSHVENNYLRTSLGLDYRFSGESYGFVEYHYNGAGVEKPEDYLSNISTPAYTHGGVFLLGNHYLVPGFSHQLTPLMSFSGQVLLNITDVSVWISLPIAYNIAEDVHLSIGSFFSIGKRPAVDKPTQFRSEFGSYPHFFFASIQVYF